MAPDLYEYTFTVDWATVGNDLWFVHHEMGLIDYKTLERSNEVNSSKIIEADTSKYTDPADRVLALAEVIKAQRSGKKAQTRLRGGEWFPIPYSGFGGYAANSYDYRIKPEPIVAYVNMYGDGNLGCAYRSEVEAKATSACARTIKMMEVEE